MKNTCFENNTISLAMHEQGMLINLYNFAQCKPR